MTFLGLDAVLFIFEFVELVAQLVLFRLEIGSAFFDFRVVLLLHLDEAFFGLKNFLLFDVFPLLFRFCKNFVCLAGKKAIEQHVADGSTCDEADQCSN